MRISQQALKVYLHFWVNNKKIGTWINNKNIFFVLAIGRSGTQLFARLLNQAPGAYVVHEPIPNDFRAYTEAFQSKEKAESYIQKFRKKEIYLRARGMNINTYGEVNSVLRRHCEALMNAFPNATFIHLIRDGRDVVRSAMSRKTLTSGDKIDKLMDQKRDDLWHEKWDKMTRFEKICWFWQVENNYLRKNIHNRVRFEELISDYEYFKQNLLNQINLNISEAVWKKAVSVPKNITKEFKIPHWTEWSVEQMRIFKEICGEEMEKSGYSL